MSKLLSSRSYVLFLLLSLSFFSCERLKEIIKPTHPKPVADTCRIQLDFTEGSPPTEYSYDQEGKLVRWHRASDLYYDVAFVYNEKDQLISYYAPAVAGNDTIKNFTYDSLGRLKQTREYRWPSDDLNNQTFTYKKDTIIVDYTHIGYDGRVYSYYQTVLIFKDDNLIRVYRFPNETYDSVYAFDITFTYTTIPNRLKNQKRPLLFVFQEFLNPFISKNLPATIGGTQGEPGAEYNWLLNEQGYPLNLGLDNAVVYTYACEK